MLGAISINDAAIADVGTAFAGMIRALLLEAKLSYVRELLTNLIEKHHITVKSEDDLEEALDYDKETRRLKRKAKEYVQLIRMSKQFDYYDLPDKDAYVQIRRDICNKCFGEFKKIDEMNLEEKRAFVKTAQSMYRDGSNGNT
jgi:hypothetical protein